MAILKKVELPNGIDVEYHKIVKTRIIDKNIEVLVHSFINKDYYEKAVKKENLLAEQTKLLERFLELSNKNKLTKKQQSEKEELVEKVNKCGVDINNIKECYFDYIILENKFRIDKLDIFSLVNIEKSLLEEEFFSNGKLVN